MIVGYDKGNKRSFEAETLTKHSFDIAVIIAPISALSYGLLYIFYIGYYAFYDIPFTFININIGNSAGILIIISLTAFYLLIGLVKFRDINHRLHRNRVSSPNEKPSTVFTPILVSLILFIFLYYIMGLMLDYETNSLLFCFVPYILLCLIMRIAGVTLRSNNVTYSSILILIFLLIVWLGSASYLIGNTYPGFKREYLFIESKHLDIDKNFIVLDKGTDSLLIAEVDLKNKKLTRNYQVIKYINDENFSVKLTLKKIGRIKK
jgi:hypothetical protein